MLPDISSYLRDTTDIGPVKAILKRLIKLSPDKILTVLIPQLPRLHLLIKKDFASGILLLTHIELLQKISKIQSPPAEPIFLSQPVTDLCLALKNPKPVQGFIRLLRRHGLRPGLATANPDRLILFLGAYSLFPDLVLDISKNLVLATSPASPYLIPKSPPPLSKQTTQSTTLPAAPPMLTVIVPVYNEHKTVSTLLNRLLQTKILARLQIIVVDDGSTDHTGETLTKLLRNTGSRVIFLGQFTKAAPDPPGDQDTILGRASIQIKRGLLSVPPKSVTERPQLLFIHHPENRGKGAAIRTALKYAAGDYTVIQDADLEYNPNDLQRLLIFLQFSSLPLVYGSRRLDNPRFRYSHRFFYLGGLILNSITNLLYSQNLTDEATCYKMFKTGFLKNLPLTCRRFEFCPEVTALASLAGLRIPEIPISYSPRSLSQGKKIRPLDGLAAILTLIKYKIVNPS